MVNSLTSRGMPPTKTRLGTGVPNLGALRDLDESELELALELACEYVSLVTLLLLFAFSTMDTSLQVWHPLYRLLLLLED